MLTSNQLLSLSYNGVGLIVKVLTTTILSEKCYKNVSVITISGHTDHPFIYYKYSSQTISQFKKKKKITLSHTSDSYHTMVQFLKQDHCLYTLRIPHSDRRTSRSGPDYEEPLPFPEAHKTYLTRHEEESARRNGHQRLQSHGPSEGHAHTHTLKHTRSHV